MAADYDTKVYVEVGGDKLVVADGGEIEIQDGGTLDILSGANFHVGTFGGSMVVNQTDNYPLGIFGNIVTAQPLGTGSTTQRAIWARMDVDADVTCKASITGAELQFRFDGADTIGSGVEAEQYSGAWLYFEQDSSGDTLNDYCHAAAGFVSVETHSDLSLSANTHLSGIEIASRLGAANGSAWADSTGTTAGLFITKAPAATGVTASDWPYGIVIENTTTAISIRDCTTGISFPAAFTGTNAILIAGTSTDAVRITGTPGNSDIMLHNGATIYNADVNSDDCMTLTEDGIQLVAGGYNKIALGGFTDWGTGATGTVITGVGFDWAVQAVANAATDLPSCAAAASYNAMTVTVTQANSNSFFATWNELYLTGALTLTGSNNYASMYAVIELDSACTLPASSYVLAGVLSHITTATGNTVNCPIVGFCADSNIHATATWTSHSSAFECKATTRDWDYGLYTAGATVGIQVTDADRVLLGGGYSTADNLPMTTDNHYLVGIFGKMATTEDITLEQRVILGRLGIVEGVTIGSAAGWGQGMSGVKGHIAFYGGSDTETYCWHNAGVFGHIQADGVATVNFKDGSHTACFYGHAGLVAGSSARTYVDSGAVIAGIALHSGIGASINNSGTIAAVYIYKDTAGNLDWPYGIYMANVTNAAYIAPVDATAGGRYGIRIVSTSSFQAVSTFKGLSVEHTHTPSTTGTACPIAITGKLALAGNNTEVANSYPGMGWGVQGHLHIVDGATIDGTGLASDHYALYAGTRGIITDGGTCTYTKGFVTAGYFTCQISQANANDGANFNVYGVMIRVEGSTTSTDVAAGLSIDVNSTVASGTLLKGIDIEGATTGIDIGACTTGIDFTNTGADGPYWAVRYGTAFGTAKALTGVTSTTRVIPVSVSFTTAGNGTGIASAGYFKANAITDNQLRIVAGLSASAAHAVNILAAVGISAEIRRDSAGGTTEVGCDSAAAWTSAIMGSSTDQYAGRLWSVFGQLNTIGQSTTNPSSAYSGVAGFHGYAKSNSVMQLRQFGGGTLEEAMLHMEATGASTVPVGILLEGGTWTIGMDFGDVCTTAIDIGTCTKAFAADSIACASGENGMSVVSTLTSGASEGIAAYFEAHTAGTPSGACYGIGFWTNIDSATGGKAIRGIDAGIWTASNLSGSNLYGIALGMHLGSGGAPTAAYMFRFNHDGYALDAFFQASNAGAVAYTGNEAHATSAGDKVGAIKITINGTAAVPGYIYVYDHPGQ